MPIMLNCTFNPCSKTRGIWPSASGVATMRKLGMYAYVEVWGGVKNMRVCVGFWYLQFWFWSMAQWPSKRETL